jgi:hypothetical protein
VFVSTFLFSENIYFFGGTRTWTQGFVIVRQALYHLSHTSSPENISQCFSSSYLQSHWHKRTQFQNTSWKKTPNLHKCRPLGKIVTLWYFDSVLKIKDVGEIINMCGLIWGVFSALIWELWRLLGELRPGILSEISKSLKYLLWQWLSS